LGVEKGFGKETWETIQATRGVPGGGGYKPSQDCKKPSVHKKGRRVKGYHSITGAGTLLPGRLWLGGPSPKEWEAEKENS